MRWHSTGASGHFPQAQTHGPCHRAPPRLPPIDTLPRFSNTVIEELPIVCQNCRPAPLAASLPLTLSRQPLGRLSPHLYCRFAFQPGKCLLFKTLKLLSALLIACRSSSSPSRAASCFNRERIAASARAMSAGNASGFRSESAFRYSLCHSRNS